MVSWNDAAEMNESVESDALVMPSSSGRPVAGLPPCAMTRSFSSRKRNLSICCFEQERRVAHVFDLHPAHHLADDHFDVLVVDVDALQAVNFLDFVDQVSLQFFFAQHGQNVVRVERAVHQRLAGLDALAFLHVDVNAARHRVFLLGAVVGDHVDFALALGHFAELDRAIDFADDGGLMRLAGFEQFHHARQTAGDVFGLRGFARDLRQHVARRKPCRHPAP